MGTFVDRWEGTISVCFCHPYLSYFYLIWKRPVITFVSYPLLFWSLFFPVLEAPERHVASVWTLAGIVLCFCLNNYAYRSVNVPCSNTSLRDLKCQNIAKACTNLMQRRTNVFPPIFGFHSFVILLKFSVLFKLLELFLVFFCEIEPLSSIKTKLRFHIKMFTFRIFFCIESFQTTIGKLWFLCIPLIKR